MLASLAIVVAVADGANASRVTNAAKATEQMYTYWCQTLKHSADALCQRHELSAKMLQTKDVSERSKLAKQMQQLGKLPAVLLRDPSQGKLPPSLPLQYIAAKTAFCKLTESRTLPVCVQPTLKVSPRKYDASVEDLYVWLCGKKNLSGPQQSLCKRHELMKGVSTETPLTERASIYKKLREHELLLPPPHSRTPRAPMSEAALQRAFELRPRPHLTRPALLPKKWPPHLHLLQTGSVLCERAPPLQPRRAHLPEA